MIPQIVLTKRIPQWWVRFMLAVLSAKLTWKHTAGVTFAVGDTVNVHHRFFIVGRYYG